MPRLANNPNSLIMLRYDPNTKERNPTIVVTAARIMGVETSERAFLEN